jgi:hypothetical protein
MAHAVRLRSRASRCEIGVRIGTYFFLVLPFYLWIIFLYHSYVGGVRGRTMTSSNIKHNSVCYTLSTPNNLRYFYMQETNISDSRVLQLMYSMMMGQ